jgi:hypothetical protein
MKIIATKKLNLIPIGNVQFSFTKRKGKLYIGELNILSDTDVDITEEQEKAMYKEMKAKKTDLWTDGHNFFTTRGPKITQVKHHSFEAIKADYKKEIFELLYG